jgi:DNA polymerase V
MVKAEINEGDILIFDRSLEPVDKKIVIAVVNGDLTVKRIRKLKDKVYLEPESDEFKPIELSQEADCQVLGVVTHAIHKV